MYNICEENVKIIMNDLRFIFVTLIFLTINIKIFLSVVSFFLFYFNLLLLFHDPTTLLIWCWIGQKATYKSVHICYNIYITCIIYVINFKLS